MNDPETDRIRQWVACWKAAGARMEELRRERLRHTDTQQSLMNSGRCFRVVSAPSQAAADFWIR